MGYHTGDTVPPISGVLDSAGAPVELSGATLAVHVKQPDKTVLTLVGTVDAEGAWSADWPSPIEQAGTHQVEVQVTWADGGVQTFGPQPFYVKEEIA